jgi:6-pyruvoyltetrahydropterin/6-carboxytetrahydropterin synthase
MFEISIMRGFAASHALMLRGEREQVHWHDWKIVVTVTGETLDDDGLLVDFHALEKQLESIVAPWENAHLNDVLPQEYANASAEQVAKCVANGMATALPAGVALKCVSVTEAPNCIATYRM